jgi:hypothetical protein
MMAVFTSLDELESNIDATNWCFDTHQTLHNFESTDSSFNLSIFAGDGSVQQSTLGSDLVEELLGELKDQSRNESDVPECDVPFLQLEPISPKSCLSDESLWSSSLSDASSSISDDDGYISLDQCPASLTEALDPEDFNTLLNSLTSSLPHDLLFSSNILDGACQNLSQCAQKNINSSSSDSICPKKPDISYIELVAKAIMSSPDNSVLLGDIYKWIEDNFPYYKCTKNSWRNSIRHNLSVNECFVKSKRVKNGRGFFWSIHSSCIDAFRDGDFDRRKARRQVQQCNRAFSSAFSELQNLQQNCIINSSASAYPQHAVAPQPKYDIGTRHVVPATSTPLRLHPQVAPRTNHALYWNSCL